ncbi:MAG: MFS transporter [Actinomycetota bacterium]
MRGRDKTIVQTWPVDSPEANLAAEPRVDLVAEARGGDGTFVQDHGPFRHYRRTIEVADGRLTQTIHYRLVVPWFNWLFQWPVRRHMRRRPQAWSDGSSAWWAPPDRLNEREVSLLGLLAMAAMSSTFANTLFTQTATFAGDSFAVTSRALGVAGAVIRVGVLIALPFSLMADRVGRRRTIVLLAWITPLVCSLGAIAPSFSLLVASQTVGRSLGIALGILAGVAATEEMPRNSRAYALSVLAMAAGLGGGVAVMSLKFADLGRDGWRIVYLMSLIWLPAAVSLQRNLLETRRFETIHRIAPPFRKRRLFLICSVGLTANLFVAPASYFQNNYLDKVHGYSGGQIALFTILTATPASIGLIVGGRLADLLGRRRLIAICTPISTVLIVVAFSVGGGAMWLATLGGGLLGAMSYPAFAVYRTELFPTGNRSMSNTIITTVALLSGSLGILAVGALRDRGWSFGSVMGLLAAGQLAATIIAYRWYPETAHLELEELNPGDPVMADD